MPTQQSNRQKEHMAMMREARAAKAAAKKANGHDKTTSVPLEDIPKTKRGYTKKGKKPAPAADDPRLLLAGELIKLVNKLLDN